jgi:hypothetical protein
MRRHISVSQCDRGSVPGRGRDLSLPPPSFLSYVYRVLFPLQVTRPKSEAYLTLPSSTEIKKGAWIAQRYSARLRARWSRFRIPAGTGNISPHHRVQNGSGAHLASYSMGTSGSFPGGKTAGACNWPLTPIYCRGQECVELYLHTLNMPSWRGAQLKHGDNFALPLPD